MVYSFGANAAKMVPTSNCTFRFCSSEPSATNKVRAWLALWTGLSMLPCLTWASKREGENEGSESPQVSSEAPCRQPSHGLFYFYLRQNQLKNGGENVARFLAEGRRSLFAWYETFRINGPVWLRHKTDPPQAQRLKIPPTWIFTYTWNVSQRRT